MGGDEGRRIHVLQFLFSRDKERGHSLVCSKINHSFKTQAAVLLAKRLRDLISCRQVGPSAGPRGRE